MSFIENRDYAFPYVVELRPYPHTDNRCMNSIVYDSSGGINISGTNFSSCMNC